METITDFEKRTKAMHLEIANQIKTIDELATSLNYYKQQLVQHDQIACLQTLKARIVKEVEDTRRMESAAQTGYYQGNMICGLAAFTFSGLFAAINNRKDALLKGIKAANSVLNKKSPFGSVFVTIGKGGLPEDVKVVPISRLSRESSKSESEVEDSLKSDGYLLMTPEQFAELLDKMKCGILDGSYSLPLTINALCSLITRSPPKP